MGISEAIKTLYKQEEKHRIISDAAAQMENYTLAKDHLEIAEAIETAVRYILSERR